MLYDRITNVLLQAEVIKLYIYSNNITIDMTISI